MNWVNTAKQIFQIAQPEHFTNFNHCEECADHDETLRSFTVDTITLTELGNPAWDPLCFCSAKGMKYYLPAMIRLTLESVSEDFYFEQMLFHLGYGGQGNRFLQSCNQQQRTLVADFLSYMIKTFPSEIETNMCAEDALSAQLLWSEE